MIKKISIFVADDHAIVREGLKLLIEKQNNMEVVGRVSNGRDAVRQIKKICPDIAVLDITMPDLNGIEATRQILEMCPSTGVVILSMHNAIDQITRCLQSGARGYVLKEAAGSEIIDAIQTVYNGHRYLSQSISEIIIEEYVQQYFSRESRKLNPIYSLSSREKEVLQLIVEGKSSAEAAKILNISHKTVNTYRYRIMEKIGVTNLPDLVKFAISNNISPLTSSPRLSFD